LWSHLSQPQAALLAAAIASTGAIVGGAAASLLAQMLNGRGNRRRQWDEIRHTAYACVTETFHAALGLYDDAGRLRADRAAQRRAADDLLAAYSRAALLTRTDGTAAALEHLHDVAQDLWDRPTRPWMEIDEQCRRAEWTFRKEARTEMGLPTRHGIPEPAAAYLAPIPASPALPPVAAPVQPAVLDSSSPEPPTDPSSKDAGAGADASSADLSPETSSGSVNDNLTENVPSAGDEHR
jgi:hypothetical protein